MVCSFQESRARYFVETAENNSVTERGNCRLCRHRRRMIDSKICSYTQDASCKLRTLVAQNKTIVFRTHNY